MQCQLNMNGVATYVRTLLYFFLSISKANFICACTDINYIMFRSITEIFPSQEAGEERWSNVGWNRENPLVDQKTQVLARLGEKLRELRVAGESVSLTLLQ